MIVVERDGVIVGCWVSMWILHAECLYIAPEERQRTSVARRLLAMMAQVVRASGRSRLWTTALTEDVRRMLLTRKAVQVPGDHFVFSVEKH